MSLDNRPPPLAEALEILEPDAIDRLFLGICIGSPAAAHEAWERWTFERVDLPSLLRSRPRLRRLLPLFHWSISENGLSPDDDTLAILRAATLWEEKRSSGIRDVLGTTLNALDRAGVPVVLLKGVALAQTAYKRPGLRHCHDIDLLLDEMRLADAQAALIAFGFQLAADAISPRIVLTHQDGLPVTLHTHLWDEQSGPGSFQSLSPYFTSSSVFEGPALLLPRMITLLQACTHSGMRKEAGSWTWMADAAAILACGSPNPDELTMLCSYAGAQGRALVLAIRLYMLTQVGVVVSPIINQNLLTVMRQNFQIECETTFNIASRITGFPRSFFIGRANWRIGWEAMRWSIYRRVRALWN
jgi:Uncharacterised nucleotidyltransferase